LIYNSFDNVGLGKVLSLLKSHNAEYLSGQDLSDVLKISRVAVWKHIKKIRSLGYKIESKQKLGYRLVGKRVILFMFIESAVILLSELIKTKLNKTFWGLFFNFSQNWAKIKN